MSILLYPLKLIARRIFGAPRLWQFKAWLAHRRASRAGVILGPGAWVHPAAAFMDGGYVTVGAGSRIAQAVFCTHDGYATNLASVKLGRQIDSRRSISIGRHSFVGFGAIVMGGARIGDDCLIGAGAVVRGRVPDGSVFIGNPATFFCTTEEYRARVGRRIPERPPTPIVQPGLVPAFVRWAGGRQRPDGVRGPGRPWQLSLQSTAFRDDI